jgi:hypothetical protein
MELRVPVVATSVTASSLAAVATRAAARAAPTDNAPPAPAEGSHQVGQLVVTIRQGGPLPGLGQGERRQISSRCCIHRKLSHPGRTGSQ